MSKKHLTSEIQIYIYMHVHLCSLRKIFWFLRYKGFTWNMERRPRIHMTNKVPDRHVHVHLHSLSSIFAIEQKSKAVLSGTHSLFYWTRMWRLVSKTHALDMHERSHEWKRNK